MDSNFEEIFQGWLEKEEFYKSKGFLKKNKSWKKYFCVLRRYDGDDNVYFQWFEKEEDWRKEFPVGSFSLFPKYAVYKRKTEKGKNVFEVSNDDDCLFFLASNEKTMDLWVIQLMMQTRLNSSMIRNSFRVKGGDGKCLQRIGAKNLNCLLHVSEWGLTLALERTHSVLSQWPLTTIRNYECTDNNEFVFEAGRKSPMGEGKYEFVTNNNEDNDIFDQVDRYTSLRAKRLRSSGNRNRLMSGDEEEIAEAYGKLRWSVMLNSSNLNLGVIPPMSSAPQAIVQDDDQLYNHLQRRDSWQSTATTAVCGSYDRLERGGSFNDSVSRIIDNSHSRLNSSRAGVDRKGSRGTVDSYDHLDRTGGLNGSSLSFEDRSKSLGSNSGRSRFQFSSPPLEDSYNHLGEYRRSSWSTSPENRIGRSPEEYNRLDRSVMSVQQSLPGNSYDRLDAMQDDVFARQGPARNMGSSEVKSRPPLPIPNDPSAAHDVLGSDKNAAAGELPPPPLPQKPSFMMQSKAKENQKDNKPVEQLGSETNNGPAPVENEGAIPLPPPIENRGALTLPPPLENRRTGALPPPLENPRAGPLPPPLENRRAGALPPPPENPRAGPLPPPLENRRAGALPPPPENPRAGPLPLLLENRGAVTLPHGSTTEDHSQYQDLDEVAGVELDSPRPRSRLNTHSSDTDLRKLSMEKSDLDPSKRTTLHRSAPSLALYSVVNKKKNLKSSVKSGSTSKLDSFLKKIGRGSKKEDTEGSYEKIPQKSKKSRKKSEKQNLDPTSSMRRLVSEDDTNTYAEINDNTTTNVGTKKMERSESSKRPLPGLPGVMDA